MKQLVHENKFASIFLTHYGVCCCQTTMLWAVANLLISHCALLLILYCMCSTLHAATVARLHVLIDTIYCLPFLLHSLCASVSHTAFCKCLCTLCLYPCSEYQDTIMLTYSYQQAVHHSMLTAARAYLNTYTKLMYFANKIDTEVKVSSS